MIQVSDEQFHKMVGDGIDAIPKLYQSRLNNVAFIVEDQPTYQQAQKLGLRINELLFGLYEGVPLPQRQGTTKILPDKITLFKRPLEYVSSDEADLKDRIARTIWHEVAHYYGLNHKRIHELENQRGRHKTE